MMLLIALTAPILIMRRLLWCVMAKQLGMLLQKSRCFFSPTKLHLFHTTEIQGFRFSNEMLFAKESRVAFPCDD